MLRAEGWHANRTINKHANTLMIKNKPHATRPAHLPRKKESAAVMKAAKIKSGQSSGTSNPNIFASPIEPLVIKITWTTIGRQAEFF